MQNHIESRFHTFDASGVSSIQYLSATYPLPSWNSSTCMSHDLNYFPSPQVDVKWEYSWTTTVPLAALRRVCGYSNGLLNTDFTTTDILTGGKTVFSDTSFNNSESNIYYKRVYCVSLDIITGCTGNRLLNRTTTPFSCRLPSLVQVSTVFSCTTGLFYVCILYQKIFLLHIV